MSEVQRIAKAAKSCKQALSEKTTNEKNELLLLIADCLIDEKDAIIQSNKKDLKKGEEKGLHASLLDRLLLDEDRIKDIADTLRQQAKLPDPIGEELDAWERPNGLQISKIRVPLGVIGMIYEARPNVTVDAASLCLKTGNAVVLRGSSSAIHSNKALVHVIQTALQQADFPKEAVQLIEDTDRSAAREMFGLHESIDVLIPRGSAKLIQTVVSQSSIPVLETGAGNCHVYLDESADPNMAINITVNAKTQRPSVCNTAETVLVHEKWAKNHLKNLSEKLMSHGVELRGDDQARSLVDEMSPATQEDWSTEYLDHIVAVKVVSDVNEAITHIQTYGTAHSEAIVSEAPEHVEAFFNRVDATTLYHNASTRFTDGGAFGFGAEIGISTQKLHARGPMGLPALTSTKYIVRGNGQVKEG